MREERRHTRHAHLEEMGSKDRYYLCKKYDSSCEFELASKARRVMRARRAR
jgi:hypothetical protein